MKISELLTSPDKWTKGCFARDAAGIALGFFSEDAVVSSWNHPRACCWCLSGAIQKCYGDGVAKETIEVVKKIASTAHKLFPRLADNGLVTFNDHPSTTFDNIREVVLAADV